MDKTAVILCGGLGTRLKPFTSAIPKPLLPIGEKAVLEIQIERLAKNGFSRIILATNYKSDYIERFLGDGRRYGVEIIVSREECPLGTAGPLWLVSDVLTEPFLVMNGDILTLLQYESMYEYACYQESWLTVGIKEIVTPFAFGNITFDGDRVIDIQEKPNIVAHALAGIYIMKPEILNLIPKNKYYGMDELIKTMLKMGLSVTKYEINDYWLDIGRTDDFEKAQETHELFEGDTK